MATKASIIDHDRIIVSTNTMCTGGRPKRIYIEQSSGEVYNIFANGLNLSDTASVYLSGTENVFDDEIPILVNGVDSGKTGKLVDYNIMSEYSIVIPNIAPIFTGWIDVIIVDANKLNQLSENYEYGEHRIELLSLVPYGSLNVISVEASDMAGGGIGRDPMLAVDGDIETGIIFGWNVITRELTLTLEAQSKIKAIKLFSNNLINVYYAAVSYKVNESDGVFTTAIAPGTLSYDSIQYSGKWFTIDLSHLDITAEVIQLSFPGHVSEMTMNEVEIYSTAQPVPEIPAVWETVYAIGSDYPIGTASDVYDGDIATTYQFGYNVYSRYITLTAQNVSAISKIRLYATSLPNVDWVGVHYQNEYGVGDTLLREAIPNGTLTYNTANGANQWFEIDLTSLNLECEVIRLYFDGFISRVIMAEIEIT